ncbi:hypothetical protein ACLI4Q_13515 [Natrialbaceae archaeon A-CW1-1]
MRSLASTVHGRQSGLAAAIGLVTPASIPGLPELTVILFIFVVMIVIPLILIGVVLFVVRRRAPGLEELTAQNDTDDESE